MKNCSEVVPTGGRNRSEAVAVQCDRGAGAFGGEIGPPTFGPRRFPESSDEARPFSCWLLLPSWLSLVFVSSGRAQNSCSLCVGGSVRVCVCLCVRTVFGGIDYEVSHPNQQSGNNSDNDGGHWGHCWIIKRAPLPLRNTVLTGPEAEGKAVGRAFWRPETLTGKRR